MIKKHLIAFLIISTIAFIYFSVLIYNQISYNISSPSGFKQSLFVNDTIKIKRNSFDIPCLEVKNEADFYFSIGNTIANDRLFQMFLYKLEISGSLSKYFGYKYIENDKFIKILALDIVADSIEKALSPIVKNKLQAYCQGINQAILDKTGNYPLPFIISNTKPLEWNISDILKLYSLLYFKSTTNLKRDFFLSDSLVSQNEYYTKLIDFYSIKKGIIKQNSINNFVFIDSIAPILSKINTNSFYDKEKNNFILFKTNQIYPTQYYPINFKIKNEKIQTAIMIPGIPFPFFETINKSYLFQPSKIKRYALNFIKENRTQAILAKDSKKVIKSIPIEIKNRSPYLFKYLYINGNTSPYHLDQKSTNKKFRTFISLNIDKVRQSFKNIASKNTILKNDSIYINHINLDSSNYLNSFRDGSQILATNKILKIISETKIKNNIVDFIKKWDKKYQHESKSYYYFDKIVSQTIKYLFPNNSSYFLNNKPQFIDFINNLPKFNKILSDSILITFTNNIDTTFHPYKNKIIFPHFIKNKKYDSILSLKTETTSISDLTKINKINSAIPVLIIKICKNKIPELLFAGGISDNPLSSSYKNFLDLWGKNIFVKIDNKTAKEFTIVRGSDKKK